MNTDYLKEFTPDLDEFKEKTMAFHNKELTVAEYKGFSGGFGSYAQRGGEKHMLRLRLAGGRLTKAKLECVINLVDKYNIDLLKLTTCQSVQLHNLEAEEVCEMIEEAWKANMISRGGGGDFPRNVMASPLSGVEKDENFDVMPYAEAAGQYLMRFIKSVKFPRKLKVCFSNSPKNEPHATFRDLGFVSNADGTFDVYIAGGLGNKPKLGVCVAEKINPSKVLYYIKAMVDTFVTYGNYENRAQSRTRFLQDTLGVDGLKKAYLEKLDTVMKEENLEFELEENVISKKGCGEAKPHKRLVEQKQEGLYAVYYQPVGGKISPAKIKEIYCAIADMEAVEIRLTPEEGMYLINCNAKEAQKLIEITNDGANTLFETSVACIGADVCQVGIGKSQALLDMCVEAVRKADFADGVLPKIHISGCPSSCAAQQIADIGFRGAMKPSAGGPRPAFAIYVGGCAEQGKEKITDFGKSIAVEQIPEFLVELGKTIQSENSTYAEWIKANSDKLNELIDKYADK